MIKNHLSDNYDFFVPRECIALYPEKNRDTSKLLYINNKTKEFKDLRHFQKIYDLLGANDVLVINETRVQKSRFFATKKRRRFEVLIVKQLDNLYVCRIKKSRKLKIGDILYLTEEIWIKIYKIDSVGMVYVLFNISDVQVEECLEEKGELPLPPYILKERKYSKEDEEHYQTIFATIPGSKASPTAGLHFTKELLEQLKKKGVEILPIQLFVSLGTFQPIQTEYIEEHIMHKESYYISPSVSQELTRAYQNKQRIIAVGTTSLRTLESAFDKDKSVFTSGYGETSLFIKPGYSVQSVDALITNFHTPRSTLFVLVSTILGEDFAHQIYKYALENYYRFFSYGDSMFINYIKEETEL